MSDIGIKCKRCGAGVLRDQDTGRIEPCCPHVVIDGFAIIDGKFQPAGTKVSVSRHPLNAL